jgi:hypothetical protein
MFHTHYKFYYFTEMMVLERDVCNYFTYLYVYRNRLSDIIRINDNQLLTIYFDG